MRRRTVFERIERAADAAAEEVLREDRALRKHGIIPPHGRSRQASVILRTLRRAIMRRQLARTRDELLRSMWTNPDGDRDALWLRAFELRDRLDSE